MISSAAAPDPAKTWQTAQKFEAVALGAFLKPMFDTLDASAGPFGTGEAGKTWQAMFVTALSKQMEQAGGLGIARDVYATMLRMQAAETPAPRAAASASRAP